MNCTDQTMCHSSAFKIYRNFMQLPCNTTFSGVGGKPYAFLQTLLLNG